MERRDSGETVVDEQMLVYLIAPNETAAQVRDHAAGVCARAREQCDRAARLRSCSTALLRDAETVKRRVTVGPVDRRPPLKRLTDREISLPLPRTGAVDRKAETLLSGSGRRVRG
jgi:hypothetical protein